MDGQPEPVSVRDGHVRCLLRWAAASAVVGVGMVALTLARSGRLHLRALPVDGNPDNNVLAIAATAGLVGAGVAVAWWLAQG